MTSLLARLAAIAIALVPVAGASAEERVDLELVLAVDASGSVDAREFDLQLNGIAAAFRDAEVHEAIAAGRRGRIAVALMIWGEAGAKKVATDWSVIDGPRAADDFVAIVLALGERRGSFLGKSGTGIGAAIAHSLQMLRGNGITGDRQVIDVSGDGRETPLRFGEGIDLFEALRRARRAEVTVNGLAILSDVRTLDLYYQRRVISGPGSFVIAAANYDDFARAIRQKLLREIPASIIGSAPGNGPG